MEQNTNMKLSIARYALGVVAASAMLTACSGIGSQGAGASGAPGLNPAFRAGAEAALRLTTPMGFVPMHQHPENRTWSKLPKGSKATLAYIADGDTDEVEVYDFPSGTEVGEQGGFEYPYGMCSDKKGDAYATDFDEGTLTEFKEGSTTGKEILSGLTTPIGCAVSKKGDIAVSQFEGGDEGTGSVKVFKAGSTTGTAYTYGDFTWPPGYDSKGDLFAEGEDGDCSGICEFELPAGGSSMEAVTLSGATVEFPGSVESNGKSMEFGDQEPSGAYALGIYSATCSGTTCTVTKSTTATSSCDGTDTDIVQWAEYGKKPNGQNEKGKTTEVAGGNLFCDDAWDIWNFPAGGSSSGSITGPEYAYGQTIVN
jgi:hypothetical protein